MDDVTAAIPLRPGASSLTPELAWDLVLAVRGHLSRGEPLLETVGLRLDEDGELVLGQEAAWILAMPSKAAGWSWPASGARPAAAEAIQILDLYMPLLVGVRSRRMVAAHLAQSLDGRVATVGGVSQFISDRPDLVHTHRMRALFDAVVVGACTVQFDDPQLTTRLARGSNPARVVLDPRGRLQPHYRVFQDGEAPTLLVRGCGLPPFESDQACVVELPTEQGLVSLPALQEALSDRGLRRLFVEGGGVTVSGFLRAQALDRLHVTVAPMIMGSGRPAFTLPEIEDLDHAIRPQCRHHVLGPDILFDCCLGDQT